MQRSSRGGRYNQFRLSDPQFLLAMALQKGIKSGPAKGGWTEGIARLGQALIAKKARDEAMDTFEAREIDRGAHYDKVARSMSPEWRNPGAVPGYTPPAAALPQGATDISTNTGQMLPTGGGGVGAIAQSMMGGPDEELRAQGLGLMAGNIKADRDAARESAIFQRNRDAIEQDTIAKWNREDDNETSRRVWEERQKGRKTIKGADGRNYYMDDQKPVLPGVKTPQEKFLEILNQPPADLILGGGEGEDDLSRQSISAGTDAGEGRQAQPPSIRDIFNKLPPEAQVGIKMSSDPMKAFSSYMLRKKGLDIRFGENGQIESISEGGTTGGGGLQRSTRVQLEKGVLSDQSNLDRINYIESLYEPDFLSYKGGARAWAAGKLNKMSPEMRDQFTQRRAAFMAQANQYFIAYRKWATGVAGGKEEMAEIKRATFSEDDTPQDFEAKMSSIKQMTKKLLVRKVAAAKEGIKPGSQGWKYFLKNNPLDGIPSAQERGDQLLKQGYKKAQVLGIMREEGYR